MKCPKCNSVLPDDSEFCQFCGIKIESQPTITEVAIPTVAQEKVKPSNKNNIGTTVFVSSINNETNQKSEKKSAKEKYCKVCGGHIGSKTKKCEACGKQYFKFKPLVLAVVLLAIFFVASAGFNVYQYYVGQGNSVKIDEMSDEISSLEGTISSQKSTISSLEDTISSQKSTISSLEDTVASQKSKISSLNTQIEKSKNKSDSFDDLISALSSGNLGYAANNFQSSESVIVVSKDQKSRKFTLTANWSNGGTVSTSYSPFIPSAYVSFDNHEWNTSTTMTIEPNKAGITTVTFSNNVDSKTFKVIIIVTD